MIMAKIYSLYYRYGDKKELILQGNDRDTIYAELRKRALKALNNGREIFFYNHGFHLSEYCTTRLLHKSKEGKLIYG